MGVRGVVEDVLIDLSPEVKEEERVLCRYEEIVSVINEEVGSIIERVIGKLNTYVDDELGEGIESISLKGVEILSDEQLKRILEKVNGVSGRGGVGMSEAERKGY